MESEEVVRRDAKSRTRRRRSMRNLRDGLPLLVQPESADDCYGSLWMETEEPIKKRKKRRESMFVGLPALQSTPIREESTRLDASDTEARKSGAFVSDESSRKSEAFVSYKTAKDNSEVQNDDVAHASANCKDDNGIGKDLISHATEVMGICGHSETPDVEANQFKRNVVTNYDSEMTVVKEQSADVHVNSGDVSDDECKLSSPDVSLTKVTPCSMSPDYPASPSLLDSFTNHGESFIVSEALITRALFPVRTKTKADILVDSYTDLNTSDKENISQNLDSTPTEMHIENNTKASPSFFSLCKSVAGKVVSFVKTSPSYLTNALLNTKTPPRVLKNTNDNDSTSERPSLNNPSTTCKLVDSMPVDHSSNVANRRPWIHEKAFIRSPVGMVADIDANVSISETCQTHQSDTSKMKEDTNLFSPFKSESKVFSEKKLRANSTGSVKKKRDNTLYYSTFNAISAVYNNEETSATDEVFTSDFRQRVRSAPEMPKSSSSSTHDFDGMDQLMQETGNTDTLVLEGHTNTASSTNNSNNITPATESSHSDTRGSETYQSTVTLATSLMEKHDEFLFQNSKLLSENLDSEESASKPMEGKDKLEHNLETDETKEHKTADSVTFSDRDQNTSNNEVHMLTVEEQNSVLVTEQKMFVTTDDETMVKEKQDDVGVKCQSAKLKLITHQTKVSEKAVKVLEMKMKKSECRRDNISHRDKTVRDQSICGVSQRKRKHPVPLKEFTEKTVFTEVKNSATKISSEEQLTSTVVKRVKAKYVAPKRKLGQFSLSTKMAPGIIRKEEVSTCSVSKKKKTSYGTDKSNLKKLDSGKQHFPHTSTIEERISKLAIDYSAKKAKSTKKPEVNIKKHGPSANFADIGKEILEAEVLEQKQVAIPDVAKICARKDPDNERNNEKTSTQDNIDKYNKPGKALVKSLESDNEVSTITKSKGRRRSETFNDIAASKLEAIFKSVIETNMTVETSHLEHEGNNEKTSTQDNFEKYNEPGQALVESLESDNEVSTVTKGKGRRRRSATFKDIAGSKLEDISETVMEVTKITEETSHLEHEGNNEKTSTQDNSEKYNEPGQVLVESLESDNEVSTVTKGKGRRRRSATFKDIAASKLEAISETVMEVTKITEEISQVNLKETASPSHEQSDEAITVNTLILPEDDVVPRRRRRRSAESASLKIQMICETSGCDSPDDTQSPNLGPVTSLKGSRKRKHESKISEEELEKLYRNKNFVKPEVYKPWHTILESPGTSGDLYGKKRLQRIIDFERPTQIKLRRRLQKAAKNGWDTRKKKRIELNHDFVETKLAALRGELDESSDTLAETLKDIVDTK